MLRILSSEISKTIQEHKNQGGKCPQMHAVVTGLAPTAVAKSDNTFNHPLFHVATVFTRCDHSTITVLHRLKVRFH